MSDQEFYDATLDHKIQIQNANLCVENALARRGWEHTCQTPGSYWMWSKSILGKTVLVDMETALRFELCLCSGIADEGE